MNREIQDEEAKAQAVKAKAWVEQRKVHQDKLDFVIRKGEKGIAVGKV